MPNWLSSIVAWGRKNPVYGVFIAGGVLVLGWFMLSGGDPQVAQRQAEETCSRAVRCPTTRRRVRRWPGWK